MAAVAATGVLCVLLADAGCGLDITGVTPGGGLDGSVEPAETGAVPGPGPVDDSGVPAPRGASAGPSDGGAEVDAKAPDTGTTPSDCPDGCKCTGSRCEITCPGARCSGNVINCPIDMDCSVLCDGAEECRDKVINCAPLKKCTIRCSGQAACRDTVINAQASLSLCVACGGSACDSVACNKAQLCKCEGTGCGCSSCDNPFVSCQ